MVKKNPHHIEMLLKEFNKRKEANPRYSLRAFARFLDMSSATLSRVLANRQEISLIASKKIIKKLNFSEHESLVFVRSIAEEKCHRAYKILSLNVESGRPFPHEKNLLFVSDLEHSCIYVNEVAARIQKDCNGSICDMMANLGFKDNVIKFIEDCLEKVIMEKKAIKYNLPLETTVGTLVIESVFSPLMSQSGEVKAVASALLNLNLEALQEFVTKS